VHLPCFYIVFVVVLVFIFVVIFVCIEEVIFVIIEVIVALIIEREIIRHDDAASTGFAAGSAGFGFAGGGYVVQK
jgi:hypothetical protein